MKVILCRLCLFLVFVVFVFLIFVPNGQDKIVVDVILEFLDWTEKTYKIYWADNFCNLYENRDVYFLIFLLTNSHSDVYSLKISFNNLNYICFYY